MAANFSIKISLAPITSRTTISRPMQTSPSLFVVTEKTEQGQERKGGEKRRVDTFLFVFFVRGGEGGGEASEKLLLVDKVQIARNSLISNEVFFFFFVRLSRES